MKAPIHTKSYFRACKMESQHFEFIAQCIADLDNTTYKDWKQTLAHHFERRLRATNSGFKSEKFLRACGVK